MTDPIHTALTIVRDRYSHAAALDTPDGFRATMADITDAVQHRAGKLWEEYAQASTDTMSGRSAVGWAFEAHDRAVDDVMGEYVARTVPAQAVHEGRHRDLRDATKTLDPPAERVRSVGVESEKLGSPAEYSGSSPIEDVALPPEVPWTAADKWTALERVIAQYGIDPGHWYDIEWPPEASLYDPGHVDETEMVLCEQHQEASPEGCPACEGSVREVVESLARWVFHADVRSYRLSFDGSGREIEHHVATERGVEVGSITQDPREIGIASHPR
ncbi:hypothetical protein HQ305_00285 [Rhodococcus sp. BP-149]|uniref:hypothetical protein n=1 Tax=unclassified Rhodococcus (in: high G+C Gram-positive bacteria) TaxID=192944 RepID=UPI001C9ACABF|nr:MULTISPECIES: hypothetical protein [unclassified Rhodococcus (in: high G+C Gram-positive bacteria)]MBY6685145.1 hypothetical protein [Rhodococcus sp. BP-288]MBY6692371.1 hypothetical protein [Rhodococcus sp. BP-188]MBY6698269.1 hypothetical protein [Rhodococcus sp. BP-285]MBY6700949.1 hypothetical protein [Rhodococcus sp. BP-283]MBY6711949.1 hypothetical protein [Rhodococcus sp. BP-160]